MKLMESCSARAFVVSSSDNVATLLQDVEAGVEIHLIGEVGAARDVVARESISASHKVALVRIPPGEPILKYGSRIGHATRQIAAGEWVHLHNCASDVDERSNTLDVRSGAPQDTRGAYE